MGIKYLEVTKCPIALDREPAHVIFSHVRSGDTDPPPSEDSCSRTTRESTLTLSPTVPSRRVSPTSSTTVRLERSLISPSTPSELSSTRSETDSSPSAFTCVLSTSASRNPVRLSATVSAPTISWRERPRPRVNVLTPSALPACPVKSASLRSTPPLSTSILLSSESCIERVNQVRLDRKQRLDRECK